MQSHTRAVEAMSRTELDYKQAQLQAMQILHAIDQVVASGGAPGQKVRRAAGCDAKSSLGDAKSSLGDAKSSLGDAESSLG